MAHRHSHLWTPTWQSYCNYSAYSLTDAVSDVSLYYCIHTVLSLYSHYSSLVVVTSLLITRHVDSVIFAILNCLYLFSNVIRVSG